MNKALIIINITKNESLTLAEEIKNYLHELNIDCDFYNFVGFCNRAPFEGYKFVITLGGDGTVLFAARNSVEYDIPIFPINLGEFGFIASIQPQDWKSYLDKFLANELTLDSRAMLHALVQRKNEDVYEGLCLNDIVISAKQVASIISLNVEYKEFPLCKLKADGVIISTPTGSTAYSAAAGGPIVDTDLDVFTMTPLNSFSLSSRPIVLNANGEMQITVEQSRTKESCITIDGQEPFSLNTGDVVKISKYKKKVLLVSSSEENFYNALRSKLNWSGGPHARRFEY